MFERSDTFKKQNNWIIILDIHPILIDADSSVLDRGPTKSIRAQVIDTQRQMNQKNMKERYLLDTCRYKTYKSWESYWESQLHRDVPVVPIPSIQ